VPAGDDSARLVGMRTNDADAVEELRNRLGPLVVPGDQPVFPNISLRMGARRHGARDAHFVYRSSLQASSTFARDQAIDAALALLHTFQPLPDGLTPMSVRALERDDSVVLVADGFAPAVDAYHRRLSAAGFRMPPHTPVLVDCATGEALLPRGRDLCDPPLERVPVSHVVTAHVHGAASDSAALALLRLKNLVTGPQRPLRSADLQSLATLTAAVPVERIDTWESRRIVTALLDL